MSNEATAAPDKAKLVTVKLEVVYEVAAGFTIGDVMTVAGELVEKAREYGKPKGQVVFGRQKFDLE